MAKQTIKFLKSIIKNHPLFEDELEFSLVANQKVLINNDVDGITHLIGRNWVNNVTAIVGKNATGKTTILKSVVGILNLLLDNQSIEQTWLRDIFIGDAPINSPIEFETYFFGTNYKIYKDVIRFTNELSDGVFGDWRISHEQVFVKSVRQTDAKSKLFDFSKSEKLFDRLDLDDITKAVLADNVSLFKTLIAREQFDTPKVINTLALTNMNVLGYSGTHVPVEILKYLDPTIEYLKVERLESGQRIYRLKFKNRDVEITDHSFRTIGLYLSSGTAKGVTLYALVLATLRTGGILFIDELENHFNHAIVRTFISYFEDKKINTKRAMLVFTTHYSELLDDITRGDAIYVARRDTDITLTRYSNAGIRQDISKTEVFDANNLNGTAPDYDAFMALKKATIKAVNVDE